MADRITIRDLEALVGIINDRTGHPREAWTRGDDGHLRASIGTYVLDGAYGGWELHQMATDGGGVHDVLRCGHVSKRDLYNRLRAFLDGMDTCSGAVRIETVAVLLLLAGFAYLAAHVVAFAMRAIDTVGGAL